MEQIDSLQIHLWVAFLDEIRDPRLLEKCRRLLSQEELQKQQRFHFERDRHRYLVTRAMVRTVLSRYAEVGPRQWRFETNEFGKPSIAPEHRDAKGIEFNVSHTDGLVVMGVARRAIGVDVENVHAREVDVEIADRYFAPAEVAALRAVPGKHRHHRFFEYWTLKESYIKGRGMGLSTPLDRFAFHLDSHAAPRLDIDPSPEDRAERWAFWQFELAPHYLIAVGAAGADAGPCQLRFRGTFPGV